MTIPAATTPPSRIEIIDVLRGFALFGIIIAHMVEQYYAGILPESIATSFTKTIPDHIAEGFTGIFISGKFFMIFSFLFGLSFFIQSSSDKAKNDFVFRFVWRSAILFAIGMLHHLHYRGDILTIYAVLGLGLLLFYKFPDKALFILAVILMLNVPSAVERIVSGMLNNVDNPFPPQDQAALLSYYTTLKSGSYLEIMQANLHSFSDKISFQVSSGRLYITFGLFLLGLYAGRKKIFENPKTSLPLFTKILQYSGFSIALIVVLSLTIFGGLPSLGITLPQYIQWALGGLFYDAFNAALAAVYVSALILLFQLPAWRKQLMHLYEAGRMGLTTYLMQTLFGCLIYFSFGLGLLQEFGSSTALGIGVPLFAVQIALSKFWLKQFNYGPVEWVWRALTYFTMPPMRRKTARLQPVPAVKAE